jgi:hypothetical protein
VGPLGLERVDVRDAELCPCRVKLLAEVVADMADALDGDVDPAERRLLQLERDARLDAPADPERGEGRGIPRAAVGHVHPRDVLRHGPDDLHVLEAGPAVLGGDVVAAEILHEAAERAKKSYAIEVARWPDEDGLPAPVGEPRERRLVGHSPREAEGVDQGGLVVVVGKEAAAAERGPEPAVVDGDDRPEARALVELEVDLAVIVLPEIAEEVHCRLSA